MVSSASQQNAVLRGKGKEVMPGQDLGAWTAGSPSKRAGARSLDARLSSSDAKTRREVMLEEKYG